MTMARRGLGGWRRIALRVRIPGLVIIHVLLFAVVFPLAYYVHFDGEVPPECLVMAIGTMPLVVLLKLVVFLATGGIAAGGVIPPSPT